MNVREQWQCAWRMARSANRVAEMAPYWLQRPEWIWDRFLGKKLRNDPAAAYAGRSDPMKDAKRRSEMRLGHMSALRRARAYEPNRVRSVKCACQRLVAEQKEFLQKESARQDALRTHLLNLIQWRHQP